MPTWMMWSLLTVVMWGFWGVLSKAAVSNVGWDQFYILSLPVLALLDVILILTRRPALSQITGRQFLITAGAYSVSLIGGLSMLVALRGGKAAVVVPITATYPALTAIFAWILLGETLAIRQQLGILVTIGGVLMISL